MSRYIAKCCLCDNEGIVISGKDLYGHRPDLWSLKMFQCPTHKDCYVGAHKSSGEPLGIMADRNLRELKMLAHSLFDPFWKSKKVKRYRLYSKLASEMGIDINECHFGYFKEDELKEAIEIIEGWCEEQLIKEGCQ